MKETNEIILKRSYKDYEDDSENNTLIDNDIQAFFEAKWIYEFSYEFYIERHFYWDWKHKIVINIWSEAKPFDFEFRYRETTEDLENELNNILKEFIDSIPKDTIYQILWFQKELSNIKISDIDKDNIKKKLEEKVWIKFNIIQDIIDFKFKDFILERDYSDYMNNTELEPLIEQDVNAFFEWNWITTDDYSFYIEDISDWKYRINLDITGIKDTVTIDFNAWNTPYDLEERLDEILLEIRDIDTFNF